VVDCDQARPATAVHLPNIRIQLRHNAHCYDTVYTVMAYEHCYGTMHTGISNERGGVSAEEGNPDTRLFTKAVV